MNKWAEIWNKEKEMQDQASILQNLIFADGFDSAIGKVLEVNWLDYCAKIAKKLKIEAGDSIYDVGCGAGAFLYPFYQKGHKIGGVDYSKSLIEMANKFIPDMDLVQREAIDIETAEKYDYVLSNGVFFYFSNLNYASEVIEKMLAKANKKVAIFDVPDLAKKEKSEKYRRGKLADGEYEKKYEGLAHLYYEKEWFINLAKSLGCKIEVFDQIMDNYGNSEYRFNVIISKD